MQDLEADMAQGHQAVLEQRPAETMQRPIETITAAPAAAVPHATHREGFTFELGLGAGGTSDYVSRNNPVTGVLSASIGGFLSNRTALLLHFAGANNEQFAKVNDINADRYHSITSLFLGPQIQFFPMDRFMLAVGVGGVARVDEVRVDVRHTRDGDTHDWKSTGGVGASVRAAVTVYQRRDAAAIRVGVEALPSYVGHEWHTSVALMGELQAF
jgi:hypothetical protein